MAVLVPAITLAQAGDKATVGIQTIPLPGVITNGDIAHLRRILEGLTSSHSASHDSYTTKPDTYILSK
jgi:hypothetical protein